MSVAIEDITENMGGEHEVSEWYSLIDNMKCYRINVDENEATVYHQDNTLVEDEELAEDLVDKLFEYKKGDK